MSDRHPLLQTRPSHISPLRQSSSLLHKALQTPAESHRSLLKQFAFDEHTGLQIPLMQAFPGEQSLLTRQLGPGARKQATLAVGLGMNPDVHEHVARWLLTVHLAFGPQGVTSHGLTHLFDKQASLALQSSSPPQPAVQILSRQMSPRKQSLLTLQVSKQLLCMHFSLKAHSESLVQAGKQTLCRQVLPSLQSLELLQETGTKCVKRQMFTSSRKKLCRIDIFL